MPVAACVMEKAERVNGFWTPFTAEKTVAVDTGLAASATVSPGVPSGEVTKRPSAS
ncbi:MAG TPA: hypothetical protein PLA50_02275 [Bacteroidia bacterium]|nr:hypothetical protein [Bacteroidia bacterium]